jgi:hypothetical protein
MEKSARIGVLWGSKDLPHTAAFKYLAAKHDVHTVADLRDDTEIMRDK